MTGFTHSGSTGTDSLHCHTMSPRSGCDGTSLFDSLPWYRCDVTPVRSQSDRCQYTTGSKVVRTIRDHIGHLWMSGVHGFPVYHSVPLVGDSGCLVEFRRVTGSDVVIDVPCDSPPKTTHKASLVNTVFRPILRVVRPDSSSSRPKVKVYRSLNGVRVTDLSEP